MKRYLLAAAIAPLTMGCLWDTDTLYEEAKGRPDAFKIIVGWFDRNPPEYYIERWVRVKAQIEKEPENLALYDDIAVACERLHRSAEAIEWMEKKKVQLNKVPAGKEWAEHHYRYLANLGTFYAHQWIALPEDKRADLALLKKAEGLIAQAIQENRDAHFGREAYQLMALRWLIAKAEEPPPAEGEPSRVAVTMAGVPYPAEAGNVRRKAVEGFSGLIQLGSAWESAEVFRALRVALSQNGDASVELLCLMRISELGVEPDINGQVERWDIVRFRFADQKIKIGEFVEVLENPKPVINYYPKIRAAAEARHEARTKFMLAKLKAGKHPDTDADFWDGWAEPKAPRLPGSPPQ